MFQFLGLPNTGARIQDDYVPLDLQNTNGGIRLWSSHLPKKVANVLVACLLNVGNPRSTGHSTEPAPSAAQADEHSVAKSPE